MNRQPKIEKVSDAYWRTIYPDIVSKYSDNFHEAVEYLDSDPKKAERMFKKMILVCGNGHLDAILHLGLLYNDTGKSIEGSALVTKAHRLAIDAIPSNFIPGSDQLNWSTLENRPILRDFHSYGLELMKEQYYDNAIKENTINIHCK